MWVLLVFVAFCFVECVFVERKVCVLVARGWLSFVGAWQKASNPNRRGVFVKQMQCVGSVVHTGVNVQCNWSVQSVSERERAGALK